MYYYLELPCRTVFSFSYLESLAIYSWIDEFSAFIWMSYLVSSANEVFNDAF